MIRSAWFGSERGSCGLSLATVVIAWVMALCPWPPLAPAQVPAQPAKAAVDGNRAMQHARNVVSFGPRVSGSEAISKLRAYLVSELRKAGLMVEERAFTARTPAGAVPMVNVIGRIPGQTGRRVLITGHYDTKRMAGMRFVGANDAGSSTALLLELGSVLAGRAPSKSPRDEIWLVFFDGEEAIHDWTETDSLYGSRQLARELEQQGELRSIRALINLDMIGDRDLNLAQEYNSDPALRALAMEVAAAHGRRELFDRYASAIEDDHVPFGQRGIPVLNLIDFSYGPGHAYWHTDDDTIDKLAPASFQMVGDLVLGILARLGT